MIPADKIPQPVSDIILRFLEGVATEEEAAFLRTWLAEDEANRRYFDDVNTTFQASITFNRINHTRVDDAWAHLSKTLGKEEAVNQSPSFNVRHFLTWKIAASVLLVIGSGIFAYKFFNESSTNQKGTIVRNAQGSNTRIVLPDNSEVWLNTNSSLEYSADFGENSRLVILKGEAFFDVQKGSKDFIVQTEKIQVHVKGTRFNVEAYKNSSTVKTTLEEGKVELYVEGRDKIYRMIPGDQVIVNKQQNEVTTKRVDPLNFSAWKEEKLIFDGAPLEDVVTTLENRYNVSIQITSERAKKERISLTVEQESLQEVLELLKLSSRLQTRTENDTIILYE